MQRVPTSAGLEWLNLEAPHLYVCTIPCEGPPPLPKMFLPRRISQGESDSTAQNPLRPPNAALYSSGCFARLPDCPWHVLSHIRAPTLETQTSRNLASHPQCMAADHPQHMPRHGGAGSGRWPHGEAAAEGRKRLPQVQGQEEQLAQGMPQHFSSYSVGAVLECHLEINTPDVSAIHILPAVVEGGGGGGFWGALGRGCSRGLYAKDSAGT